MAQHFIITIGRQLGSGGKSIAQIISRRLGVKVYDKELVMLAARESGLCPECFDRADEVGGRSLVTTLMNYLRSPFAGYEGGNSQNVLSAEALFKVQSDVIRKLAAEGPAIFVGRCADYILRDEPNKVDVFITATDEERIRRISERTHCTADEAREMMKRGDERRAEYYNYFSFRTWGAASSYDLAINSSAVGDEAAAEQIIAFAERKLNMKF